MTKHATTRRRYTTLLKTKTGFAAGLLSASIASAAPQEVQVNQILEAYTGVLYFNPIGNQFVHEYDPSFPGAVRFCGLNFMNFDVDHFAWTSNPIGVGDVVNNAQGFNSDDLYATPPDSGVTVYRGYRFNDGVDDFFGYISVTGIDPDFYEGSFLVNFYRYNATANEGITVIPEPSTYALGLGLFMGGILVVRRYRSRK